MENIRKIYGDKISYGANNYEVLQDADALIIATEWQVFRNPDFNKMAKLLKNKVIFDGRNLFEVDAVKEQGFEYFSIGRGE